MPKLLTISVAAYNAAETLDRCLSSCVLEDRLDDYEVIVVNDGSQDETSAIAHGYAKRYPKTFSACDKENGGYGSTVNYSLAHAKGRYFKLLDSDDAFKTEGLAALLDAIEAYDVDWFVQAMTQVYADGSERLVSLAKALEKRRVLQTASLAPGALPTGMWFAAFKKEALLAYPLPLSEKVLYQDTVYMARGIAGSGTALCLEEPLYRYSVGTNEAQSMSEVSRIKHLDDFYCALENVLSIALNCDIDEHPQLYERARVNYLHVVDVLTKQPASPAQIERFKRMEGSLKAQNQKLYDYMVTGELTKTLRLLRKSAYLLYWPIAFYRRHFWKGE